MSARAEDYVAKDRLGLFALGLYLTLTALFFGRLILADPWRSFLSGGTDHDPSLYMWCLVWWPYAIAHRLNPFLSRIVWAPTGVNLAWVTSLPGLALLAAPLTRALGPVATYNLLCLVCPPLAGWAAFALCRHLTRNYSASLLGGYLFAFSPYMLGRMLGQLVEMVVFPVPLAALLVLLLIGRRLGRAGFVALMATLLVAEFSFAVEVFATMTVFGAMALGLAFVLGPPEWRGAIRATVPPLAASYVVAMAALAPYLYHLFAFGFPHGAVVSPKAYSSDLLNFLVPTPTNLLGANHILGAISAKFPYRPEACAYVALPLLAIIAAFARLRWKTAAGRFLVVFLGAVWLASLGPRLHVAGHLLFVMPWKAAVLLPLIKSALPGRFALYGSLAAAVITALWMSERAVAPRVRAGAAILTVLFTLPNLSARFWTTPVRTPSFFLTGEYRNYLGNGENVLVLPYALSGNSMLWQAETGMYFRMAGAHTGPISVEFERWPIVTTFLFRTDIPDEGEQFKAFLAAHDVGAVIIDEHEPKWWTHLVSTLSVKPIAAGGVLLYRVPASELQPYRQSNPLDLEARFDRARFERLLIAAQQYRRNKAPLESLTPLRAEQMGLLPAHWAAGPNVYTRNGLWLGPLDGGKVSVGVVGSWEALKPLIDDYRVDATTVYFPYPRRLKGAPRGNTFMRKLVMVFDAEGLQRAVARARARTANSPGPRHDGTGSEAVSPEVSRRGASR